MTLFLRFILPFLEAFESFLSHINTAFWLEYIRRFYTYKGIFLTQIYIAFWLRSIKCSGLYLYCFPTHRKLVFCPESILHLNLHKARILAKIYKLYIQLFGTRIYSSLAKLPGRYIQLSNTLSTGPTTICDHPWLH